MPLGNWTSQFFANVYLNELDQFVKHKLRVKYYIRYVDDFVIFHNSKIALEDYKLRIEKHLEQELKLKLHPDKSRIIPLKRGIPFLGFRIFYYHKLVQRRNIRKIRAKLDDLLQDYEKGMITASDIFEVLQGWNAYALHGNTCHLRQSLNSELERRLQI